MTIVETRAITGGVDTHADVHVAAALDPVGGLLGVREFPATAAGYASCYRTWLAALRGDAPTAQAILAGLDDLRTTEDPQDQALVAAVEEFTAAAGEQAGAGQVAFGALHGS